MARDDKSIFVMFAQATKHLSKQSFTRQPFKAYRLTLRSIRFNIQKLYIVITWNLCFLYGSRNKQQILPYTTLKGWFFFITEVESVYCAVRTESLYNTDTFRLYKVNVLV
jgi:hypothetical protein